MCIQGIMATQGPRDGDKNFNASWCPSQAGYWTDDYAAADDAADDAVHDAANDEGMLTTMTFDSSSAGLCSKTE